jgi:hypothetical protein
VEEADQTQPALASPEVAAEPSCREENWESAGRSPELHAQQEQIEGTVAAASS